MELKEPSMLVQQQCEQLQLGLKTFVTMHAVVLLTQVKMRYADFPSLLPP